MTTTRRYHYAISDDIDDAALQHALAAVERSAVNVVATVQGTALGARHVEVVVSSRDRWRTAARAETVRRLLEGLVGASVASPYAGMKPDPHTNRGGRRWHAPAST